MIKKLMCAGMLMLMTGCSSNPAPERSKDLLATELTYSQQKAGWTHTLTIDPWLASRPELVRAIRAEYTAAAGKGYESCSSELGCSDTTTFQVAHSGPRLVSLLQENDIDGGGAHPITRVGDYLFDVSARKKVRFGDIFSSWTNVRPLIQSAFCANLRATHEGLSKCPDVQGQAITLFSTPMSGKVTAMLVSTQDYALGSYADGRESVRVEVSRAIYEQLREEYRNDFQTPQPDSSMADDLIASEREQGATAVTVDEHASGGTQTGPGNCKPGDELAFTGGWVTGAAGSVLTSSPVAVLESVLASGATEQQEMSRASPLRPVGRNGCIGIALLDPRTVYLGSPLGGGPIKEGRYLVVWSDFSDGGRNHPCMIAVQAKDVVCRN